LKTQTALVIHPGYINVEVALSQNGNPIDTGTVHKHKASRDLIPLIDLLLTRNSYDINSLTYLAAQQGPGPFTTLRVALATINGLGFASTLPMIAVNGIEAFAKQELATCSTRYLIVLLNAFCEEVYFAIADKHHEHIEIGCTSIEAFLDRLKKIKQQQSHDITMVGNAVSMYKQALIECAGDIVHIPPELPQEVSLAAVVAEANRLWQTEKPLSKILPLYLKESSAHLGKTIPSP